MDSIDHKLAEIRRDLLAAARTDLAPMNRRRHRLAVPIIAAAVIFVLGSVSFAAAPKIRRIFKDSEPGSQQLSGVGSGTIGTKIDIDNLPQGLGDAYESLSYFSRLIDEQHPLPLAKGRLLINDLNKKDGIAIVSVPTKEGGVCEVYVLTAARFQGGGSCQYQLSHKYPILTEEDGPDSLLKHRIAHGLAADGVESIIIDTNLGKKYTVPVQNNAYYWNASSPNEQTTNYTAIMADGTVVENKTPPPAPTSPSKR